MNNYQINRNLINGEIHSCFFRRLPNDVIWDISSFLLIPPKPKFKVGDYVSYNDILFVVHINPIWHTFDYQNNYKTWYYLLENVETGIADCGVHEYKLKSVK